MKQKNQIKTLEESKETLAHSFDNKVSDIKLQVHISNVKNDNIDNARKQLENNVEHFKKTNKLTKNRVVEIGLEKEIKKTMKSINEVAQFFLLELLKKDK